MRLGLEKRNKTDIFGWRVKNTFNPRCVPGSAGSRKLMDAVACTWCWYTSVCLGVGWEQLRNMWGGGAECPLETSDWEISAELYWERRGQEKGKRGENWEEKKENCKREGGKVTKQGEELSFFFCLSLSKTTLPPQKNFPVYTPLPWLGVYRWCHAKAKSLWSY